MKQGRWGWHGPGSRERASGLGAEGPLQEARRGICRETGTCECHGHGPRACVLRVTGQSGDRKERTTLAWAPSSLGPRTIFQAPCPGLAPALTGTQTCRCPVAHCTTLRSGISHKGALRDKWEPPQNGEHPGEWQKSPRKEPWGAWPVPNPTVCHSLPIAEP